MAPMRSATKHTALKCFGAKKHWRENVVAKMYRLPNVGANVFRRQNGAAKTSKPKSRRQTDPVPSFFLCSLQKNGQNFYIFFDIHMCPVP